MNADPAMSSSLSDSKTDSFADASAGDGTGSLRKAMAYAAPAAAGYFFYIPMWSILPGIYAKHFGLSLSAIAGVVLFIRLFDGFIDTAIGYLSDYHRSLGGSRKPWVFVGAIGAVIACYFLFNPPLPATTGYYLTWSMVYFLAFVLAEIPHLTWGSELAPDYHQRAQVFGVRYIATRVGMITFFALPLLPIYASSDYTPEVLQDGVLIGAVMAVAGLLWALNAPTGTAPAAVREDSWRLLYQSLVRNKPLLLYFGASASLGLAGGMWYAVIYFYLDGYLGLGSKVALIFLMATVISAVSTPVWVRLIHRTSKATVWAIGILLFVLQMIAALMLEPGVVWWVPFALVVLVNLFFSCHDIAATSTLGDIADYGKLKFGRDRGATYFGLNTLLFKIGLGFGGGLALAVAGSFGFEPAKAVQSEYAILGLKLSFAILPLLFAIVGAIFVLRTPLNARRHRIIQRRIESRALRAALAGPSPVTAPEIQHHAH